MHTVGRSGFDPNELAFAWKHAHQTAGSADVQRRVGAAVGALRGQARVGGTTSVTLSGSLDAAGTYGVIPQFVGAVLDTSAASAELVAEEKLGRELTPAESEYVKAAQAQALVQPTEQSWTSWLKENTPPGWAYSAWRSTTEQLRSDARELGAAAADQAEKQRELVKYTVDRLTQPGIDIADTIKNNARKSQIVGAIFLGGVLLIGGYYVYKST